MTTPSPLVIIRCGGCRKPLDSLDEMPTNWSGTLSVIRCRTCVIPSPRRFLSVLAKQKATGFGIAVEIPLAALRPYAQKAKTRGRAVDYELAPFSKAE